MPNPPAASEAYLYTRGGLRIFYRTWPCQSAHELGAVVIAHGFGEHSGRYAELAHTLCDHGYTVYALDHRGHGRSEGRRGHVDRFDDFAEDLDRLIGVTSLFGKAPQPFLIGHSGGGLIAIQYASRHGNRIKGLILSSPLLGIALAVPPLKVAIGRLLAKTFPHLTMRSGVDPFMVSHDQQMVQRHTEDPLIHDRISLRLYEEIVSAMERAMREAGRVTTPSLCLQAGDDRIVSVDATKRFFNALGSRDKTLKIYDGWYHEVFNEVDRLQTYSEVAQWLAQHLD